MIRRLVMLAAVAAVAVPVAAQATPTTTGKLEGKVSGDNAFKIDVERNGQDVKTLKAGRYVIVVKDPATIHNFRLKGPGLNRATSVSRTGTFRWTITLKKGRYTYQCDPHAATGMRGTFLVK
jgi:plastocyanin